MRVLKRLFGEEFNNLLVLNLITAALFVPIITIGPAILALKGTLIKVMDGRCALSRVQEYKSLFKKKFWRGVLLEVLFALYALVILWCKTLSDQIGQAGRPLLYVAVLAGALAALVSVCTASILSCVQMPFTQALWNGVCLALGRLPRQRSLRFWPDLCCGNVLSLLAALLRCDFTLYGVGFVAGFLVGSAGGSGVGSL